MNLQTLATAHVVTYAGNAYPVTGRDRALFTTAWFLTGQRPETSYGYTPIRASGHQR